VFRSASASSKYSPSSSSSKAIMSTDSARFNSQWQKYRPGSVKAPRDTERSARRCTPVAVGVVVRLPVVSSHRSVLKFPELRTLRHQRFSSHFVSSSAECAMSEFSCTLTINSNDFDKCLTRLPETLTKYNKLLSAVPAVALHTTDVLGPNLVYHTE